MVHENNSKRLLLIIGWVNVVAALLLFQAFCGLMAISVWGLYLKRIIKHHVKMTKNLDSWSFYN